MQIEEENIKAMQKYKWTRPEGSQWTKIAARAGGKWVFNYPVCGCMHSSFQTPLPRVKGNADAHGKDSKLGTGMLDHQGPLMRKENWKATSGPAINFSHHFQDWRQGGRKKIASVIWLKTPLRTLVETAGRWWKNQSQRRPSHCHHVPMCVKPAID